MRMLRLSIRGATEAAMLLLLVLLTSSAYADTAQLAQEHEAVVVLDVENMT